MLNEKSKILRILAFLVLISTIILVYPQAKVQAQANHVYYGYVPPSTDVYNPNAPSDQPDEARRVEEMDAGELVDYYVPLGTAILDMVGYEDDTSIEIVDIYANQRITLDTLNKYEKKHFFIPFGTFFKVVASKRVGILLSGGASIYEPDGREEPPGGTSTFYPTVTGGFRGRESIFVAAPATHPFAYSADRIGYNFYLMALEETDWSLVDAVEVWSQSGHLTQHGIKKLVLQSRTFYHMYAVTHGGGGNNVVFHLITTGDVLVSSLGGLDDFVAVPAITGGYVGRLFYTPAALTFGGEGRSVAFMAIPLEEGRVTVYDGALNVIAERTFTSSDVENRNYWYYTLGEGEFDLIVQSTGNITLMAGKTDGGTGMEYMGDDISFIAAKPNQEIRFYAPAMALIFAPEDLSVSINGEPLVHMRKDEFNLLASGVHSIIADKHILVEILAVGNGWSSWGSYLVEPLDADVSFEVPTNFTVKPADYTMYIGAAVVGVVVIIAAFLIMRRHPKAR